MKAEKKDPLWEVMNCGIWLPDDFSFGIGMKDPSGAPLKAGTRAPRSPGSPRRPAGAQRVEGLDQLVG